jgi:cysteine desulfurase
MAVSGVMAAHPGKKLIVGAIEHDSVLAPAGLYGASLAPVDGQGVIDIAALERMIDDDTVLVSVMYANNEVGSIQSVRDVSALVDTVRKDRRTAGNTLPLYVHTDAAQAGNHLDLHVSRLGVDLMTLNGGKIYGPKQSGVLYVKGGTVLSPLILGGGQERGLRSGTENVAGAIGFAAALQQAQGMRHDETGRLQNLQQYFIGQLQAAYPKLIINGSLKRRLPNNLHITIPGQDNERLLYALDERGVMAAAGSACSASSDDPSHVLRAIGLSDDEARASLRFTMGRGTSREDIDTAVKALMDILAQ